MSVITNNIVLLFYQDYERDTFFRNDRYLKRVVRPLYHAVTRKQKVTGFLVWYRLLAQALRQAGYDVRENDYRFARKHPEYPVGLVGYPSLLDGWNLPNPAVLGPALFDHPAQRPSLMADPRFMSYLVTCHWMGNLFEPVYGAGKCRMWHAGIDTQRWVDTKADAKTVDFLIYDKVRWDHDAYDVNLIQPILRRLRDKGLTYEVIRYKFYDYGAYQALLRRSRAMIFLCEHETQGMGYQECLASNVPILAWDNGYWLDPNRTQYTDAMVPASSVPYFSPECGERFVGIDDLDGALDRFLGGLDTYMPRAYVERELSFDGSAKLYMDAYEEAGRR